MYFPFKYIISNQEHPVKLFLLDFTIKLLTEAWKALVVVVFLFPTVLFQQEQFFALVSSVQ